MNNLVTLCFVILSVTSWYASAQDLLSIHPGARGGSMGSIKSVHSDVLSMYGNEAGLAHVSNLSFYISAERRFNNEGLNFYSFAGAFPSKWGSFGLLIKYFGFDLYNEQLVGLAYGRKLSKSLSIGAQFDYLQLKIASYGNKSTFTAEFGILAKLNHRTSIGFHVYNPFEIAWIDNETLPTVFNLGLQFIPTDKVSVVGELEKIAGKKENLKVGLQYTLVEQFALRIGVNTSPALVTFGVGYQLPKGISFDAGSTVHQQLGISPMVGIGFTQNSPR